ncbi:methylmalonyl-CoA mutase [Actinoplanes octamycinicus]|uniref:Methylmalonyl-CoA mutase n=1 Tax=Actinoplanes octamycinicus TaxID=135948 RepID=A0A7W7GY10_9ACTN|nr:methylmalonyl-CoA mutase subunit beta [Actinoplanes octamycinicus]MBB4740396.1 methylmalonyl-CoA mutase [Actinoplanes octamycinicus]GIE59657.1 methylmalonyl-CoA mutase [Actinoplanes octamycinicus]
MIVPSPESPGRTTATPQFPPRTTADWRRTALLVLQRAGRADERTSADQVDALLATTSPEGIRSAPLYTVADALPDPGIPGRFPFVRGGRPVDQSVGGWDVRQRYADPDPASTRDALLADLRHGVTSLWLVLGEAGLPVDALSEVLAPVQLDQAGLVLDAGNEAAEAVEAWLRIAPAGAHGSLGLDPLGVRARLGRPARTDPAEAAALALRCATRHPGMRTFTVDATVHHDAGAGDAEELGFALATGVEYLRALTAAGFDVASALDRLEFRYAATADQFATIAKFRAARRLWARVAQVCGVPAAGAQRQHAVTSAAMMTVRAPWSNLLRTTIATFAAGIGGADAITVQPFDLSLGLPGADARRLARNTHAVLLDEAGLARVADPAGGSWYVERLTADLAAAAWDRFTEIERAGGMEAALDSGMIADRLAETWDRRHVAISSRAAPIIGVTEFPDLDEQLPLRVPAPAGLAGGLPRHRYAETFEALRDRAEMHTAATGRRPTVFLATLGPPAVHNARAAFAAGLFAAGGIAVLRDETGDAPADLAAAFRASGLSIVCLCSSDKRYAEDAGRVAAALAAAGARRVWMAGRPGPYEAVNSYLYAGCDAVDVLRTTLSDLEVA